jgi:colanic acid/amylovoran biosynthesis glycosyltransferase
MPREVADDRPVVVHCAEQFVAVTENWIYHQVVGTQRYRPVVATEHRANADQFPFEPVIFPEGTSGRQATDDSAGVQSAGFSGGLWPVVCRLTRRRNRLAVPLQTLSRIYEQPVRVVRPALLHAHFGTLAVHLLRLRRRLGVPLVTTFYGYDAGSIPGLPGWRQWYDQLFAIGDRFLVEGSAFRRRLIELGCPAEKVTVQHLGVDLEKIPFQPRLLSAGEPVRLLMAASFREKKGHEYALRAFAAARRQLQRTPKSPPIELCLIGDGERRPRIEALIRELELGEVVTLLGPKPHAAFLDEAMRCHLFLSPSVTAADGDTEGGAPVGLIEASATGMPVLASWHADIPEVVRDGETGWLAPERDVPALTTHLVALLQRPESWPAMGERGRRHVESEYNLRVQAQRLDSIYDDVRREAARSQTKSGGRSAGDRRQ